MLRAMLSAVVLATTALPVATDINCDRRYLDFVERLSSRDEVSGDRLANLHRGGLRIFDACDAGHLDNPEPMFRRLEKS